MLYDFIACISIKKLKEISIVFFLIFCLPLLLWAQNPSLTVSGQVRDNKNNALQGVSVILKGTARGTTTDGEGRFVLNDVPANGVLVLSSTGFASQEIAVSGKTSYNVNLVELASSLEEVVVVGYGTQKKVNLTGAVSAITAEDLRGRPITATSSGMQGLIPGVTIRSFTAMLSQTGSSIRIRGIGTLGDSNPLIVIDGIPGKYGYFEPG